MTALSRRLASSVHKQFAGASMLTPDACYIRLVFFQIGADVILIAILPFETDREGTLSAHVVITGASSGLGAALAHRFATDQAALSLFGRDLDRLSCVADACRATAEAVNVYDCDVTDAAMAGRLADLDARRPVDILIANAGLGGQAVLAPPDGEPLHLARRITEVNVLGVINTVAPLVSHLCARGQGHIVIVSSFAALNGLAEAPVYSASKAAIRVYGEGLRRLLAPKNVRVSVVLPGFIATPMSRSLPFRGPFEWTAERAAARIVRGIAKNEAEIVFPWQLRVANFAVGLMPLPLRDKVLNMSRVWTGQS